MMAWEGNDRLVKRVGNECPLGGACKVIGGHLVVSIRQRPPSGLLSLFHHIKKKTRLFQMLKSAITRKLWASKVCIITFFKHF